MIITDATQSRITSQHTLVARAGSVRLYCRDSYCGARKSQSYIVAFEDGVAVEYFFSDGKPSLKKLAELQYQLPAGTPTRWTTVR